ncbi:hypothetical protein AX774_g2224 [Zancudomyces culisetae]|uniref:Uncharacterized protein n=1 Tax=Zancudomyces culisetae TaxID=1213189 RepID=A0A1R1PTG9_ZANCU|nr:hypothetical protein AX774_g2224 [Zancudomyces culisetae]|eukprot:OMH84258.1 hypothetical protein AX774_g2224 [Zancudomyces culisetae]
MCRTKQSQRHTSQQQDENDGGDDGLEYDSDGDIEYNNGHGRMMQMAYEQGSHHKVVEFYEFTERLEKSLQRNMTQVLMDASDLVLGKYGSGNNYDTDNSDWVSELYDNRDLSIVKKANYTNSVISSAVVQQFQQQTIEKDGGSMIFIPSKHVEWPESIKVKGWLKMRSCILGMLVEILQLGKTQNPDESQNQKIKGKLTKMIRRVDMDLRRVGSNDHDSSHVAKIYESKTIDQLINELGKHAYSDKCGIDQREEAFEVLYTKLVVGVAVLALQEGNESVEDSISVDIGEKVIWGHGMQGKEKSVQTFMEYVCELICNYLSTHGPVDATQSNDQMTTDIPTCIRLLSLWAQVYSVLKKTTQADNLSSVKQL